MGLRMLRQGAGEGDRPLLSISSLASFWVRKGHSRWHWPLLRQLLVVVLVLSLLSACGLPQLKAEDRLFLDLSLNFLDVYTLPKQSLEGIPVGGFSALAYDRQGDRLYALSDDRSQLGPARFYTLKLALTTNQPDTSARASESNAWAGRKEPGKDGEPIALDTVIDTVTVEHATPLLNEAGEFYPPGTVDPEGLALSPQSTVLISTEAILDQGIDPMIGEFDRSTGQLVQMLPVPARFKTGDRPNPQFPNPDSPNPQQGMQDNLGFESLALSPTGTVPAQGEPFRLFVATEGSLIQDQDPNRSADQETPNRFLHYLLGDGPPVLIAEHWYPLSPPPPLASIGLTDLLALDGGGHFLALERTFSPATGFGAQVFQLAMSDAVDTSSIPSLKGDLSVSRPIRKRFVMDLADLGIPLDNLEGMTLGPRLPDGTQSLIMVSDDNFRDEQVTQFLLFRLDRKN